MAVKQSAFIHVTTAVGGIVGAGGVGLCVAGVGICLRRVGLFVAGTSVITATSSGHGFNFEQNAKASSR